MSHKAGYINIIGLPNVGKSTLLNAIMGERLSAVTPKAQTTRHRILGMVNAPDYQLIFSDTPGFINQPAYELQKRMNDAVEEALEDADVLLFVTDKFQQKEEQQHLIELLQKTKLPVLVLVNKADLCTPDEIKGHVRKWEELLPGAEVIAVSALSGVNRDSLLNKLAALMPESPPYYDKDQITDRQVRFFVTEIVREKIFLNYDKEVPYSTQVEVTAYKESEEIDRIKCEIYVERESQKAIIIGKNGEALKKVGIEARKAIEELVGKKVHLELFVKVKDKWRNNDSALKNFGYRS